MIGANPRPVPNALAVFAPPFNALRPEMPVTKSRPRFPAFWAPDAPLPEAPDGYLFPVDAFNKAGRALSPSDWTDDEMRIGSLDWGLLPELPATAFTASGERDDDHAYLEVKYHSSRSAVSAMGASVPAYTPKFRQDDYETVRALGDEFRIEWVRARLFRDIILKNLCKAAASGDLKSVIRPKGSGDEQPMELRFWKTDSYAKRFIPCAINPEFSDDELVERTHRIFLEEAGLDPVIEKMLRKEPPTMVQRGLPEPAPLGVTTAPVAPRAPSAAGRKRGRKTNPVWAKAYAKAYKIHRQIAVFQSDEGFRAWIIEMPRPRGSGKPPSSPQHCSVPRRCGARKVRALFEPLNRTIRF